MPTTAYQSSYTGAQIDKSVSMAIDDLWTDIPTNSNLDNYNQIGNFRVPTQAIALTISNIPYTGGGGNLEVRAGVNSTAKRQFYYPNNVEYFFYRQIKAQNTSWIKVANSITVYSGSSAPSDSLGSDGDIYLQI